MDCENKRMVIRHVQGNVLRLAIPLTLRSVSVAGGEATYSDEDFVPEGEVVVTLKRGTMSYPFTAVMDGHVAVIEDQGTLPVGVYSVTVECRDGDGAPLRFKRRGAVCVVDATADAGVEPGVEFEAGSRWLDAAVFLPTEARTGDESDPVFRASPAAAITEERMAAWDKGGKSKAGVDPRPVVHRCIPFRPQVGTRYYFEQEVLVAWPNSYKLPECLNEDNLNNFSYLVKNSYGIDFTILRLNYRHRMVKITNEILDDKGKIDIDKIVEYLENRDEEMPTIETRSPNFRIERGKVMCVARMDKKWAMKKFDSIKFSNSEFAPWRYENDIYSYTLYVHPNVQAEKMAPLNNGSIVSLAYAVRPHDNVTEERLRLRISGVKLIDNGFYKGYLQVVCMPVNDGNSLRDKAGQLIVPDRLSTSGEFAGCIYTYDFSKLHKAMTIFVRNDKKTNRLRIERGSLLRGANLDLRRKVRGYVSCIPYRCKLRLLQRAGVGHSREQAGYGVKRVISIIERV